MVLLNVLWMCAWPRGTFFFSRRLPRWRLAAPTAPAFVCCFAIIPPQVAGCRPQVADYLRLRRVTCDVTLLLRRLLLDADRLALTAAAGARVGACALAAHRHTFAVPQPAVTCDVHQPLDVQLHFAPQIAF